MNNNIALLDCTLRDGGHVNNGNFGKGTIKSIIKNLVDSKIDIIEAGFLWDSATDANTARYNSINELKSYLPDNLGKSKIALMADNVDLSNLEAYDGTVEFIRLSFRKTEFEWAEKTLNILKEKGYKCYINPIHGSSITDDEYLRIIEWVNSVQPYAFSIVDTFGAMRQRDLGRIYYLVENNLDNKIALGIHLHENLGLAYSLARYILEIASPLRKVIIDGSLYGIGKIPGNLCIEQVVDCLNTEFGRNYSTEPLYDAIDDYIMPIYNKTNWGYSIPYALSAQCGVHRTYAEYLVGKNRLHTKDIRRILKLIDERNAEIFNKAVIEEKYQRYLNADYDDTESYIKFRNRFENVEKFLIVAPGKSIQMYDFEQIKDRCIITVNFLHSKIHADYSFFTNSKRLSYVSETQFENMIITSNLQKEVKEASLIFSRNELTYHDDVFCDDSTLMLLNLLKRCKKSDIYLAGFDGFVDLENNFYDASLNRKLESDDLNYELRRQILKTSYSDLRLKFVTPSMYDESSNI